MKFSGFSLAAIAAGVDEVVGLKSGANARFKVSSINGSAVTALTSVAGVVTVNCALGDYFTLALTENITSWVFTNTAGVGFGMKKRITITQNATAAKTVAMPTGSTWAGGAAGVVSAGLGAVDVLEIVSTNNATTWRNTLSKAFS